MILQKSLIDESFLQSKVLTLKNIKAYFTPGDQGFFDIVLEINSNKFFLSVQRIEDTITTLEVVAVKGFVELTQRLVLLIRQLVSYLFLRAY